MAMRPAEDPNPHRDRPMRFSKRFLLVAALCSLASASTAIAQTIQTVGCFDGAGPCDAAGCDTAWCDEHGCDSAGCLGGGPLGALERFNPFTADSGWDVGGWVQLGYHSQAAALRFNDNPDGVRLHQAWLYAEKAVDGSCGLDLGGRIDYIYGIDGPDTQAFGPNDDSFDQDFDNGGFYGHAIPQLYGEAAYGDLSVKVGHFYTLIGYETVSAPDNFFYSHNYSFFNNEPFTHTGFLATYQVTENWTTYGGYTLGWDSGFEDNGDSYLGGSSFALTDDITLTYASVAGTFNTNVQFGNIGGLVEDGYMNSIVLDTTLTDRLQWVSHIDVIDTEIDGTRFALRDGFAWNNYLFYAIDDNTSVGTRFEYFHREVEPLLFNDVNQEIYDVTFGVNRRFGDSLVIRPEVRVDYDNNLDSGINEQGRSTQTTFGMDAILVF